MAMINEIAQQVTHSISFWMGYLFQSYEGRPPGTSSLYRNCLEFTLDKRPYKIVFFLVENRTYYVVRHKHGYMLASSQEKHTNEISVVMRVKIYNDYAGRCTPRI